MDASPPPTPPSTTPRKGSEWRFKTIGTPCEWIERYHPGGYHPVNLGDFFNNGQYKVLRKLGEGSFSTVWLARDLRNNRYVALKILVASNLGSTNELRMLRHIAQLPSAKEHITQLLDDFEHRGPNGIHKCLVFDPMGPTVNTMVEELPQFRYPRVDTKKVRYPPWMAKSILKQSLQALAFLHENGIAQGDFQPGNMLFALDNIDSEPEDALRQNEHEPRWSVSPPVQRLDGKQDKWAPRHLYVGQPLAAFTPYAEGFKLKLSDMGCAYFLREPPTKPIVPIGLRAPELVLTGAVNNTFDVWSFGCLVFEFMTGRPLFCVPGSPDQSDVDDDHLQQLTAGLGPLPDTLYKRWKRSSLYYTPERKLFNCAIGGVAEGEEPLMVEQESMEQLFDEAKPDISEEEAQEVKALIRLILQYDPAKRPSAADLLRYPWFCN